MRYQFKEFEFDTKSLVLTKNGEDLSIRHNEAKVLALLITGAEKVFTKEEILSSVWQDKVVSEQAVFQNISHLRNLFGNDAIKTFPKRGYQWQLTFKQVSNDDLVQSVAESSKTNIQKSGSKHYLLTASLIIVLAALLIWNLFSLPINNSLKHISYIPFTNSQANTVVNFEDNEHFDFTALTNIDSHKFSTSAELEYHAVAELHPLVLTGNVRRHNELFHLEFSLKGPLSVWKGQLSGKSQTEVIARLQRHLKQSFIYDIVGKQQPPEVHLANLSIAHQESPNDFVILGGLINSYLQSNEFDKAMVLAEKMANTANTQSNSQQAGNAYLYQSTILTRKQLFDLSSEKLSLAIIEFEKINDLKRHADALNAQSWIDHKNNDYAAIKRNLLQSAQYALDARDIPRELHALTYLSIMAHKHSEEHDKYYYLRQAEAKMNSYELPIYHFAKIPFHYAIFAEDPSDKEPHYKHVLDFTKLTPDHWVAQVSRKNLVEYYISQNRANEAKLLIDELESDNADNSYLKALVALAQNQNRLFVKQAQKAFEQAQMAGDKTLSLDVALLLCDKHENQANYDFFSQYIRDNGNDFWRKANEDKLTALNL